MWVGFAQAACYGKANIAGTTHPSRPKGDGQVGLHSASHLSLRRDRRNEVNNH